MPLVISRTPFRLSFFGGGTDYPAWYRQHGGAVLSAALDKYCYITARQLPPFFDSKHRIVWSHIETVNAISEILHPAVRAGLLMMGFDNSQGIELHHQGDLPARSGIGSSSSFAVGLINALSAMRGLRMSKEQLATSAIALEQQHLKDSVGSQDQVAAAFGGLNLIRFKRSGTIAVEPLALEAELIGALERRLMLFFVGVSRLSSELASSLIANLDAKHRHLEKMHDLVFDATEVLRAGRLDDFGRLLHETWCLKRKLAGKISSPLTDEIYETARGAGALGGKLLGAGGSGFMAFYVPEARQDDVRRALANLLYVPVGFDFSGSTLIDTRAR